MLTRTRLKMLAFPMAILSQVLKEHTVTRQWGLSRLDQQQAPRFARLTDHSSPANPQQQQHKPQPNPQGPCSTWQQEGP